jgi:hypothetical protein
MNKYTSTAPKPVDDGDGYEADILRDGKVVAKVIHGDGHECYIEARTMIEKLNAKVDEQPTYCVLSRRQLAQIAKTMDQMRDGSAFQMADCVILEGVSVKSDKPVLDGKWNFDVRGHRLP